MNTKWEKRDPGVNTVQQAVESLSGLRKEELLLNVRHEVDGMNELAEAILAAGRNGQSVFVVADYDADGITSGLILSLLFKTLGVRYEVYIPRRESDGYGVNSEIAQKAADYDVLMTVDNGIAAREVLDSFKMRYQEKKVFVLDHHLSPEDGILPKADVLVDPEARGKNDFTHYCAAGLCYKLAEKLMRRSDRMWKYISILAMVGTIADVMPLIDENRTIVREGLSLVHAGVWKSLAKAFGLYEHTTAKDIAFNVAPAINALGRLEDEGGQMAYELLLKAILNDDKEPEECERMLLELVEINKDRKAIQSEAIGKVSESLFKLPKMCPLFVKAYCTPGIAGIVAGRIAEQTGLPTFVLCPTDDGTLRGSARNGDERLDFHVKDWMDAHKESFLKYGGHESAAGLSMTEEDFCKIQEACVANYTMNFGKIAQFLLAKESDKAYYDLEVPVEKLSETLEELDRYEPFGEGCPKPVVKITFNLKEVYGKFYSQMGNDKTHIRLNGDDSNGRTFSAIGFGMYEKFKNEGFPLKVSAIGEIGRNYYKGRTSIQLEMSDIERAPIKPPKSRLLDMINKRVNERMM